MKMSVSAFLCAAFMFAALSRAQPANSANWIGVWQGELDGNPSVVLTLADDTGQLGGTVVLNIIQKEDGQAHIVAKEPHVLLDPHVDGDALAFQFRKLDGGLLDFTIKRTAADKATIHCLNCGPDAPTVDLARSN
jgi:hypothetical protein